MARAVRPALFNIREGERRQALALFGHLLIIISVLIILKSVSSALFLKRLDPESLPYLYVGVAFAVSLVVAVNTRFIDRVPRRGLIIGTTLFFASNLVVFRILVSSARADWIYPLLYLWVEIYAIVMATHFWTFAGDIFTGRQGRRLFGIVGAGGVMGSILGGAIVTLLAERLGSENLLSVALGLLLGIPVLVWIATRGGDAPARPHKRDRHEQYVRESVAYFRANKYPRLLAGIVFATVVATTFIDYQFKVLSAEATGTDVGLAKFFGQFNLIVGVFSLLVQLFLTSFILNRLGVFAATVLMPLGLVLGASVLIMSPGLFAVFLLKLIDSGFSHTVDKSGRQLLYVPLPERLSGTLISFFDGLVNRVGLGVAGVLLIPLAFLLPIEQLSYVTLAFLLAWVVLVVRTRAEYRQALQASLREGGERPSFDPQTQLDRTTVAELLHALESGDESQVTVALELLGHTSIDLTPYLRRLLEMPSPEIRERVLRHVEFTGDARAVDIIVEMLGRLPREATAAAVEAIARLDPARAAGLIKPFLSHRDPQLRGAAIRAVLSDGRWDANDLQALVRFEEILHERVGDPEQCRLEAARALADPHLATYRYYLLHYIRDGTIPVQRAAIEAAGATRAREYLPILVEKTLDRVTREAAIDALARYGDEVLPLLQRCYDSADGWSRLRKNVVRSLSEIGTPVAANMLLERLKSASSSERFDIIKALNKMRAEHPDVPLDESLIQDGIFIELEDYYRNTHYVVQLADADPDHLLLTALAERRVFATERVSRLLALIYPPNLIFSIYRGLYGRNVRKASNAHELLENLIDRPTFRRLILPLFDDQPPEVTIATAEDQFAFLTRAVPAVLQEIIAHSARWLRICALYFAGDRRVEELRPLLEWTAREDADAEVRRTAQLALGLLEEPDTRARESRMDTLVEKVLFLKEVEIFSGLTGEDLTEVAGYLREVSFTEGEVIFEEGDPGDALYVLRSGEVEVITEGRRIETRRAPATLGELSAVDQGPRTFRAVAATQVEAYEIGELELTEILQENADISRMMLRVLAGRIRRYMQLELKAIAEHTPEPEQEPPVEAPL